MHPTRENASVRKMVYRANSPAKKYPAIPRHAGSPDSSFSAPGMISSTSSRRYSSAPPVKGSPFLKAAGLSHGVISQFQSRLLMDTRVNEWAASILYGLNYLLSLIREGVEIDNRGSRVRAWKKRYSFAGYYEGSHTYRFIRFLYW